MIYTSLNENGEIIFNEASSFKSKEEAERALRKIKNNEKEMTDYLAFFFKATITVWAVGILGGLLIQALTKHLSFPGSAQDKVKRCQKFIKKCDNSIDRLRGRTDDESKKLVAEYEKARKFAVEERDTYERDVHNIGKFKSKWNESTIFDDVEMV